MAEKDASRHHFDAVESVRLVEPGRIAVRFWLGSEMVQEWNLSEEEAHKLGGLLLDMSAVPEQLPSCHRTLLRPTVMR